MKTLYRMMIVFLSFTVLSQCGLLTSSTSEGTDPFIRPEDPRDDENPSPPSLVRYANCEELVASIQAQAIAELDSWEEDTNCYEWSDSYDFGGDIIMQDSGGMDVGSGMGPSSSSEEPTVSFTDTNLQEGDVDESDIIVTDGQTIYVSTSAGVDIFNAWPLNEFSKIATYETDGIEPQLFLYRDRLLLVFSEFNEGAQRMVSQIEVVDVSNPATPSRLTQKFVEGTTIRSRMVDGVLHVVLQTTLNRSVARFPFITWEDRARVCSEISDREESSRELSRIAEAARQEARAAIMAMTASDWLPIFGDSGTSQSVDCSSIVWDNLATETPVDPASDLGVQETYYVPAGDPLVGIYSLDLDAESAPTITFVQGSAYEVYASSQSIYLAGSGGGDDRTGIHRFSLGQGDALHAYFGSTSVSGHIINSFSMGEYDGSFRIATTVGNVSRDGTSEVSNSITTLDISRTDLPILGTLEDIAVGEEIYAVRFIGKKGYIVTFKKVDPLFVIDLTDPSNPIVEGELKVPGYSTYLHPLDEDHLIGLGKDAEDMGTFAWYQGLKLSLFDITDGSNPMELDNLIIGSRGTESPALSDHHAFTFDRETGILALPLTLYEGSSGGSEYGDYQYDGVHLYSLSVDAGIGDLGQVILADNASQPRRTIMIASGEERGLYILDRAKLYLVDMNDPTLAILGEQDLSGESYDDYDIVW